MQHLQNALVSRYLLLLLFFTLATTNNRGPAHDADDGHLFDSENEPHQPLVMYVNDIPLHTVIRASSDPLALGRQQCEELLENGRVQEENLNKCSEEFATALRPHIAELREDIEQNRERTTFNGEQQTSFLMHINLSEALQTAQESCHKMQVNQDGNSTTTGAGIVGIHWLLNPEQPELCGVEHDAIFSKFGVGQWLGTRGFVNDFLGTRTNYDLDCLTPSVVPSRRIDCELYERVAREGRWQEPIPSLYPSLDEEYFEWLDVLKTVDATPQDEASSAQVLVVVEVGAAHGVWATRAWRANELLHRRRMHIVLVEPHPKSVREAYQHLALNGVDSGNFTIWQAAVVPELHDASNLPGSKGVSNFSTRACSLTSGHRAPIVSAPTTAHPPIVTAPPHTLAIPRALVSDERVSEERVPPGRAEERVATGRATGAARGHARGAGREAPGAGREAPGAGEEDEQGDENGVIEVSVVGLSRVMSPFELVHLLDIDVQGVEMHLIPDARHLLLHKVQRMHIGTHDIGIHQTLRKVLREDKWTIEHDYPPLSSIRTLFGWTSFRDGLLSARNPRL